MEPEERRVLEAMQLNLKELNGDVSETVGALVAVGEKLVQVSDAVMSLTSAVGQMSDSLRMLDERLGKYIQDSAKERSGVRDVDRRLRIVENKVST